VFVELMPLLKQRTLLITVARIDEKLKVNVIPVKAKEGEDEALTTPLSYTGSPEELDRELGQHLASYVDSYLALGSTLAEAKAEIDAAARPARDHWISSDTCQRAWRQHGCRGVTREHSGTNAGFDRVVELGTTPAHVFRRRASGDCKIKWKDVSPPSAGLRDLRARTVRPGACGELPPEERRAFEKCSLLEHRCAGSSLSGKYAGSGGVECEHNFCLGSRVFRKRIHAPEWRCKAHDSFRWFSRALVNLGRAEALSRQISRRL
jgi:PRTRC genetic system protein E